MNLTELHDQIATIPTYEERVQNLSQRLGQAEAETARLLSLYEKERRDVENMQRDSLTNYIRRLLDKYEDKAEKEQQEELAAKLAYDRAFAAQQGLREELDRATARLETLQGLMEPYKAELARKREELLNDPTGRAAKTLMELETERRSLLYRLTQTEEALLATDRALEVWRGVADALDGADGWATFDMLGGRGILTHMIKYSKLNQAEAEFHRLTAQLREVQKELDDLEGFVPPALETISFGSRMVDFWFDNIFTDFFIRSKIQDNIAQIHHLRTDLDTLHASLDTRMTQLRADLARNSRQQETWIVGRG